MTEKNICCLNTHKVIVAGAESRGSNWSNAACLIDCVMGVNTVYWNIVIPSGCIQTHLVCMGVKLFSTSGLKGLINIKKQFYYRNSVNNLVTECKQISKFQARDDSTMKKL